MNVKLILLSKKEWWREHQGETKQALLRGVTADSLVQWWQNTGSDCSLSRPSTLSTMYRSVREVYICSRDPSCLEDHSQDKNTPQKITQSATEGHSQPGWNSTNVAHKMRSGKYETRQGRKTVSQGGTSALSLHSVFFLLTPLVLFIHKRSQMAAVLWCKCRSITELPFRQETGLPGTWIQPQTVL